MGCCSSNPSNTGSSKKSKNPKSVDDSSSLVQTLEIDKQPKRRLTQNVIVANMGRDIHDYYELDRKMVLGSGISGQVKIGVHKETRIQYAIKSLSKRNLRADKLARLQEEIRCMAQLDHPNILRLHEYFENDQVIYLVLELCTGGELLDRLHEQQGHHYNEHTACRFVHTILTAIAYCHSHNIVHRDLKLENFLFEDESPDSDLKLIDFGLSHYSKPNEVLHRAVGTPYYVAPEVLQGNYDSKCDIWSIGVIAFMLVSGTPPFYGKNDAETLASVKLGRWHFDEQIFKPISKDCKDFISKCLTRRPHARPTAAQALKHKWFKILHEGEGASGKSFSGSIKHTVSLDVIGRLNRYVKRSRLSKIIMDVVAHTLLPEQIGRLREEFQKFDVSGSGEITLADMRTVLAEQSTINQADIDAIFQDMDIDQTGLVSYHEFIAATISRQKISENNLKIAFERMSGHEQKIDPVKIKDLLGHESNYNLKEIMEEVGLQESSSIDFDQFKNIMYGELTPMMGSPTKSHIKRMAFFKDEEGFVTPPNLTPRMGHSDAAVGTGAGGQPGLAGRKMFSAGVVHASSSEPHDVCVGSGKGGRTSDSIQEEDLAEEGHTADDRGLRRVGSAPADGTTAPRTHYVALNQEDKERGSARGEGSGTDEHSAAREDGLGGKHQHFSTQPDSATSAASTSTTTGAITASNVVVDGLQHGRSGTKFADPDEMWTS